jgi:hypothetical protein
LLLTPPVYIPGLFWRIERGRVFAAPVEFGAEVFQKRAPKAVPGERDIFLFFSLSSLFLSRLELSDIQVYEPSIRALLGIALHMREMLSLTTTVYISEFFCADFCPCPMAQGRSTEIISVIKWIRPAACQ